MVAGTGYGRSRTGRRRRPRRLRGDSLAEAYGPFPASAEDAIDEFVRAAARWRSAVSGADADQAVLVGYSGYPWGLDRTLPFVDIVWWVNRELIHHGADIALIRDLYLALGG